MMYEHKKLADELEVADAKAYEMSSRRFNNNEIDILIS